ncbi:MAG: electron transporter RnfD [Ruminococcus sp.]|nr:electron transporter RnfD [Ruminococcus sp.]
MKTTFIPCTDERLAYMGRLDDSKKESVRFIYAGSQVTVRFKGTYIAAVIANTMMSSNEMSIGALVDGKLIKSVFDNGWDNHDKQTVVLAEGLEDKEHTVTLFKRQAAYHFFEFYGFELSDGAEVSPYKKHYDMKIEVFGDSVSAGEVVEAVENTGSCDPDNHCGRFDNAYYAYPMITARNLNAEIHNNAQGGIAIFNGTGYFHMDPEAIGVETTWDKLSYYPEGPYSDWDFSRFTPDVVIMAVGQNDPHCEGHEDRDIKDPEYRKKWKAKYKEITSSLMEKYPKAQFIFLLTVLMHYPDWDEAVKETAQELDSERVHYFEFTRTGKATPGHPRIYEQYEMAEELTAYIVNSIKK